jgi:hypothetical protein
MAIGIAGCQAAGATVMRDLLRILAVSMIMGVSTIALGGSRGVDLAALKGWDIVVSQDAIPSEAYAAEEFRDHYQRASGITLPIVQKTDREDRHIFIGAGAPMRASPVGFPVDDFKSEDLRIIIRDDNIAIAGGRPRGTLYGVYTFLEKYLGVRFLTPDHTHVPPVGDSRLTGPVDFSCSPPLVFRYSDEAGPEFNPAFATRVRFNEHDFGPMYGGHSRLTLINHTFYEVMPTTRYGKEHPEYYSLIDGQRKSQVEVEWYQTQLCLTNPDVLRIITDDVLKKLRDDPGLKCIPVAQNDSLVDVNNFCQCPNCKAINDREGTTMGSVLAFVTAVADRVAKEFPNVTVGTLAYHQTLKTPRAIRPRPNVLIQLCTIQACVLHPLSDPDCPQNVAFGKVFAAWRAITDNISVWDYNMSFGDIRVPCPRFNAIAPNIRHLVANHALGVFMEGAPYYTAALSDLRTYVTANLLWDPNLNAQQLVHEFVTLHYGSAAPAIFKYLKLIQDAAANRHADCFGKASDYGSNPAVARAGLEAFAQALKLADNDEIRHRVEKASICAYRAAIEPLWYVEDEAQLAKLDPHVVSRLKPLVIRFFALCDEYELEKPNVPRFEEDYVQSKARLEKLLNLK